ncbi:MAG: hypothetical protein UR68_C0015G0021 [Candidatus Roizmanbacteria bacterium GW2011_GWA2_35_19]|uniref:Right handed beta helix domain-containing protein n=1 Tax=Candidatus Roizmanbacteria bacterium GW2011_GWA2_35_19 TaxID=1618478 RepID=A0A0G0EB37_9BACT|nr:MAG: hypothetical protein UR68_C0015G0021 [Candidatus Roizmanbacteria bacterium GW2011_GWA2_35_19]
MPAALTFLKVQRIIQVDSPQVLVEVQDLINQIRSYEEQLTNMDYGTIANAYGKQPLGGGSFIGITLELINNWRLAFEARSGSETILCTVSGGNLVAINVYDNNPIYPTAFTQVVIAQSSSPTIIQAPSDYATLYMLESLRGRNTQVGSIWYWNPTSGSDLNDGTTPANAVATFSKAQSLAGTGTSDIIFALATNTAGVTTVTEKLNITKANLKVRGPGHIFQFVPATTGSPTINIAANNVEVSGFYITTAAGGTDNGITISTNNVLVENCWIQSATGNGIDVSSSTRTKIDTCAIENCTSNGINIGTSTTKVSVTKCIISGNADGIDLTGTGLSDNVVDNNLIFNHSGYGIDITGAGVTRTTVRGDNTFNKNTSGNTHDLGTDTYIETQAGGASASEIADAVWDELIASHTTAGTAGRTLKDAKTKATLASLK